MEIDPFFAMHMESSSSKNAQAQPPPPPPQPPSSSSSSPLTRPPSSPVGGGATIGDEDAGAADSSSTASLPPPPPSPAPTPSSSGDPEAKGGGQPATATAAAGGKSGGKAAAPATGGGGTSTSEEDLNDALTTLAVLLQGGHVEQRHVSVFQSLLRENSMLKEKIAKLKSLLGRSAKAQKDAKLELIATRAKLDESNKVIASLNEKVEQLANRPTHYLDLVADFESNFDRALHAIDHQHQQQQERQSGGEDSSSSAVPQQPKTAIDGTVVVGDGEGGDGDAISSIHPPSAVERDGKPHAATSRDGPRLGREGSAGSVAVAAADDDDAAANAEYTQLLVSELDEARARIDKLEGLESALLHRASKLERQNEELLDEREGAERRIADLERDLKQTSAEAESARTAMREKAASLAEMQLEIDLVTKASVDANARANNSIIAAKTVQTDKKYVGDLESKVNALTEWALASAEAKKLAVERNRELESKIAELQRGLDASTSGRGRGRGGDADQGDGSSDTLGDVPDGIAEGIGSDRRLFVHTSSKVIGAGLVASHVVELGKQTIAENEIVLLRWKFDITPSDLEIFFSILKGPCEDSRKQEKAETLIRSRVVVGGAGGEVEGAFAIQNACTLVWSNEKSWVRPRTIKFTVEAIAVRET